MFCIPKARLLATLQLEKPSSHQAAPSRGEKTLVRKHKELEEKRIRERMDGNGKRKSRTFKGAKIIEANEKTQDEIQDKSEVVIIGSDVKALYPSLSDIEVALICYQAILDSDVKFLNFNFRAASLYIAMHLTEEEQRRSYLYRVIPIRTAKS